LSTQFPSNQGAQVPLSPEDTQRLSQERREEVVNAPKLTKYFNQTLDVIADLDRNENLKIHNSMVRCVAYYDGRWDGQVKNGEWVDNQAIDGEILPKDNEYKKQIDKLNMEMCRNRISYEVEAIDKWSAPWREAAEFATHRIKVNQNRIETEPFIQGENMSLLLKTVSYRYTFFDKSAESRETETGINVLKHLTQGSSMLVCRTCGASAEKLPSEQGTESLPDREDQVEPEIIDRQLDGITTQDSAQGTPCPHCGDTVKKTIGVPESEGLKLEYEEKPSGRVASVRPDSTMVQLDLNARDIPSSSFLKWRLVLRRCDWEMMFPDSRIPSSRESEESRHRSHQQSQASNNDTPGGDDAGGNQFEKIEGELVWLDPKVYQRYKNKETEQLKGGDVLQAGEPIINNYPDGVCVARIGNTILDIYPSDKNKCWTMCVYGLREHALHGSGTLALLGPQDTVNDLNAYIQNHALQMAAAREFIRADALEGGNLPSINEVGIVTNAPDDQELLGWAYGRSQPDTLSSEVFGFREAMRGSVQDAAGTSSLSMQGAADMKALGTATGVEASRDQAVGRMIPNRKLQAHMGTEWCKQVLELERENYTPETFLKSAGKTNEKGEVEYTERGVRTFFQSKSCDFMITPSNFIPTTPAQDKANASDFGQIAGQLSALPNASQLLSLIAPKYDIDYDVNEFGAAQRSASMRLEEYAKVCKLAGDSLPTPETVQMVLANTAEWARVNPTMDNHLAYRNYFEDWWASDEGRNANPLLRMVVQTVHDLHLNKGIVTQAQQQSSVQIASKAPEMAAAEQVQAEQEAKMQEQSQAAGEQSKQDAVMEAVGKQALAQQDREHASQVKMDETEHKAVVDTLAKHAAPTAPSAAPTS
jgi:hypothetical protein